MFDDAIHFLTEMREPPDWGRLGQHLPVEWIEEAVANTEAASIRKRRLPAEQVVWLVAIRRKSEIQPLYQRSFKGSY